MSNLIKMMAWYKRWLLKWDPKMVGRRDSVLPKLNNLMSF
jgi:hypothetical protein